MKIRKSDTTRIPLTDEMIRIMKNHQERTGVGASKLISGKRDQIPDGLNASTIQSCLRATTKTVRKDHYECIIRLWEELPDNPYGTISEEIKAHFKRAQPNIINNLDCPQKRAIAHKIAKGQLRRAPKNIIDAVMAYDVEPSCKTVEVSPERLETLHRYRDIFGLLPGHIFKITSYAPGGLNAHMISSWMNGKAKTAKEEHLKWVIDTCEALLNEICEEVSNKDNKSYRCIREEELEELKQYGKLLQILPTNIFHDAGTIPEGLKPAIISSWIKGKTLSAQGNYIDWVLRRCRKLIAEV